MGGRGHHHPADPPPRALALLLRELVEAPALDEAALEAALRRHPKDGRGLYSKRELMRGLYALAPSEGWQSALPRVLERLRTRPVRTASGVAPVTVLTRPFPCPGACVFCPSDVRMPKSYLAMEPGAQRAAQHAFDPYAQTSARLRAYHDNGHPVDKVELIVLGGSWSAYAEGYQRWFIARCFAALNDFASGRPPPLVPSPGAEAGPPVDGLHPGPSYNQRVRAGGVGRQATEDLSWDELRAAQRTNERAACRMVGLSVETRPDLVDREELRRLRGLGVTKLQLGVQSLDDTILAQNRRGHDAEASRRALDLARRAAFKLQVHWMANLLGADPASDRRDFTRLFEDPAVRPDELKLYPLSLVQSAEIMQHHRRGEWRPYAEEELLALLVDCLAEVPRWCRLSRVVRDIPAHDIVAGSRESNLRERAEARARALGRPPVDIRAREIRRARFAPEAVELRATVYTTRAGEEHFLEALAPGDRLLGFLRLCLPTVHADIEELAGAALVRELHVYGALAGLGERGADKAQHLGLGRRLLSWAEERARQAGRRRVAIIASVGTREYYRALGYADGELYLAKTLGGA